MNMIYLLLSVLISVSATAADFGLMIGAGQTPLRGDNMTDDLYEEMGLRLGIPMRFSIDTDWTFRTGVIYASRKYQVKGPNDVQPLIEDNYEMRFEYLDIPALAEYQLLDWLKITLGPIIALNTGARAKGSLGGSQIDQNINEIAKSPYFLGQVGLGFQWGHIGLDITYERGLSSFSEDEDGYMDFIGMQWSYWFNATEATSERGNFRYQRSRN